MLLVHDDHATRQTYSRYLESAGMSVETAADPIDGHDDARDLRPNLLITDVRFRGRPSGVDLVRMIKQDTLTSHIPIIVLTAAAAEALPAETQQQADVILVEPVLPDLLLTQAQALIADSHALRDRSNAAIRRASSLIERNLTAHRRRLDAMRKAGERACPKCGSTLHWLERYIMSGVEHDFYRSCAKGCGVFCYDGVAREWIRLG